MPLACFLNALSSPAFPFGSGGTPEGTRYTKVLPPSSRRQATVHRTVAFEFSSPFYLEYKNGVSPKGYTRNKMFPFHPHPYGARLKWKRTLPRAKNSPPDCFYGSCAAAALSSPAWGIKNSVSRMGYAIFGTPEGTRTPNPRNRNPMLYPLSHWRISESPIIIAGFPGFVKRKWKKFLLPADSFCANGCFSQ